MEKYLKNPLILAASAGVLAAVVSYIDHKINTEGDFEPDMSRYFKVALLVAICTYGAITLSNMQCGNCPMTGGSVSTTPEQVAPVQQAPWTDKSVNRGSVSDQIHTGTPDF